MMTDEEKQKQREDAERLVKGALVELVDKVSKDYQGITNQLLGGKPYTIRLNDTNIMVLAIGSRQPLAPAPTPAPDGPGDAPAGKGKSNVTPMKKGSK